MTMAGDVRLAGDMRLACDGCGECEDGRSAGTDGRDACEAQVGGWMGEQATCGARRRTEGMSALARMSVPTPEEARHYTRNLWWDGRLGVHKLNSSTFTVQNVYKFEELALLVLGPDGLERPLLDSAKLVLNSVEPEELLVWVRDHVQDDQLFDALVELLADAQGSHDAMVAVRRCLGRRWRQYRQALGLEVGYSQDEAEERERLHPVRRDPLDGLPGRPLGPEGLKEDFPLLAPRAEGGPKPPVYLDAASTSQKPQTVLDAVGAYYSTANGNPYRSIYPLATYAERLYDAARDEVASFIGASYDEEVAFTGGATEALNMVAWSWGLDNLGPGDNVVVPMSEHHSNLVPWQQVCARTGAKLVYLYPDEDGRIPLDQVRGAVDARTKVVALAHASNVLGLVNPVAEIARIAHEAGALVVLDAAQSVAHVPVDVAELGADFMAFSGHKVYGPMGVGVLWGRLDLMRALRPLVTGGGMISTVDEDGATWAPLPRRLEAGTPNVAGAVGLAQAVRYLRDVGMDAVGAHEKALLDRAVEGMRDVPGVKVYGREGEGAPRCGLVSFNVGAIHAEDVARGMARRGVYVKSGNHCAQPLMRYLGVTATCRLSVGVANSTSDVDAFLDALHGSMRDLGERLNDSVGG